MSGIQESSNLLVLILSSVGFIVHYLFDFKKDDKSYNITLENDSKRSLVFTNDC